MNLKKRVVLMSAELSTLNQTQNNDRTAELERLMLEKGLKFGPATGSYKGTLEKSFVIDASEDILPVVDELARKFGQESVLVVDENQKATLIFSDGKKEVLGQMMAVDHENAGENWTLVNGQYFTVKVI